ncbi:hypothetical protein AB0F07_18420 [Streptomyces fructofermentans]|uniref:hypothetical protein n=1 Tax=Streptomyces fructofermentans TaxID=152141 RepID=UPI003401AD4D
MDADATLSLCLRDIARVLVCSGPHSDVRVQDPADHVYGPVDRIRVLIGVGWHQAWAEAGSPLWPGDGLMKA